MSRVNFVCVLVLVMYGFVGHINAFEHFELGDKTADKMKIDPYKSIVTVQNASDNEFKFENLNQVDKFIEDFQYLREIASRNDAVVYFGGQVEVDQVLSMLNELEPMLEAALKGASHVLLEKIKNINYKKNWDSEKKLESLVQVYQYLQSDESDDLVKQVYQYPIDNLIESLASQLISDGPEQIRVMSEDVDTFGSVFNNKQETYRIEAFQPFCKLSRPTAESSSGKMIQATPGELEMLANEFENNNETELNDKFKNNCNEINEARKSCPDFLKINLQPAKLIDIYVDDLGVDKKKFLSNEKLAFYYHIMRACRAILDSHNESICLQ